MKGEMFAAAEDDDDDDDGRRVAPDKESENKSVVSAVRFY